MRGREIVRKVWLVEDYAGDGDSCIPATAFHATRKAAIADVRARLGRLPRDRWNPEANDATVIAMARQVGIDADWIYAGRIEGNSQDGVWCDARGHWALHTKGGRVWLWRHIDQLGFHESNEQGCGGVIMLGVAFTLTDWASSPCSDAGDIEGGTAPAH